MNGGRTAMRTRSATGFDVHAFGPGDHVMLGGTRIPHDFGLVGHSDADVALHALTDAILGLFAGGEPGVAVATITLGDGITVLNAALGAVRYRFPKAATKDRSGIYLIQVDVTDGDGNLSTAAKGQIRLEDGLLD